MILIRVSRFRKRPRCTRQPSSHLSVEENEKRLLEMPWLEQTGIHEAAELMGISRRTLHRKLARWPELDLR